MKSESLMLLGLAAVVLCFALGGFAVHQNDNSIAANKTAIAKADGAAHKARVAAHHANQALCGLKHQYENDAAQTKAHEKLLLQLGLSKAYIAHSLALTEKNIKALKDAPCS